MTILAVILLAASVPPFMGLTCGLQLDKSPLISSTTAESNNFILDNFCPKSVAKAAQTDLTIGITISLAGVLIEVAFSVYSRLQNRYELLSWAVSRYPSTWLKSDRLFPWLITNYSTSRQRQKAFLSRPNIRSRQHTIRTWIFTVKKSRSKW